jgi:microcystin degradation protein MlrC
MQKDILVVKSTNHFHAGFAPIAAEIIYVDAPSSYPVNPRVTDYQKMTRPIWPRVENPW